jgi:hypothetical protein
MVSGKQEVDMALSPDATLADVVSTLEQPEEYVRCVLSNMHACKKEQDGDVAVTIGITGGGKVPFYRVDTVREITINNKTVNMPGSFPMYNGRSHRRMDEVTRAVMQGEHWSKRSMNYEEVRGLLGQLRNSKRV